jgi:hypothetical protein
MCRRFRMEEREDWRHFVDRTLTDLKEEMKGQRELLEKILIVVESRNQFYIEGGRVVEASLHRDVTEDGEALRQTLAPHARNVKRVGPPRNVNVIEDVKDKAGSGRRPGHVTIPAWNTVTLYSGRSSGRTQVSVDTRKVATANRVRPLYERGNYSSLPEDHLKIRRIGRQGSPTSFRESKFFNSEGDISARMENMKKSELTMYTSKMSGRKGGCSDREGDWTQSAAEAAAGQKLYTQPHAARIESERVEK